MYGLPVVDDPGVEKNTGYAIVQMREGKGRSCGSFCPCRTSSCAAGKGGLPGRRREREKFFIVKYGGMDYTEMVLCCICTGKEAV